MKSIYLFAIIFLGSIFSCCFTSKKHFYTYKNELDIPTNSLLQTNGVYYNNQANGLNAFAFYKDGLVKLVLVRDSIHEGYHKKDYYEKKYYIDQSTFVSEVDLKEKELWGAYSINYDSTIILQQFGNCHDCFFRRMVLEKKGIVLNDSTILFFPTYNYESKKYFDEDTLKYDFIKTNFKPDSSQAWFLKKRWYKKGLHESRKIK